MTTQPAQPLTAVILGAGYAAEGHTIALREAGVHVVAMASRNESACRKMAESLGIPRFGSDWRQILEDIKPTIVAVATPGGAHRDMVRSALTAGCHIFCEKPLATTAVDARELYQLAKTRGVKTAYAATCWYQPQILYVRELVKEGVLGRILELEFVSHFSWPDLMPFGWIHRREDGGGRLHNNLTHLLAIAQQIVGGDVLAATGECRYDLKRAPIAQPVHDFREYVKRTLSKAEAEKGDWAEVTSDWSYSAIVRIGDHERTLEEAVTATFRHSARAVARNTDYVAIYGKDGTIHIEHVYAEGSMFINRSSGKAWEPLAIPDRILSSVPGPGSWPQRLWAKLARDFVDDICGSGLSTYPTFREGWIYQEVIDIIRAGVGWTRLAADV